MHCINCGAQLPDDALFCSKCGKQQVREHAFVNPQPETPEARRFRRGLFFLENWLAFVAVGVLATITMILFAIGSRGFAMVSAANILQQFCLVGALAVGAMVSTRTGGLDLSVGGMMALSAIIFAMNASENNAGAGFLLALVVCGALGLLNGLFILVMRLPSILVTVASAVLIRGIALWASDGNTVALPKELLKMNGVAAILALLGSVIIAILLLWRTGAFAREKKAIHGEMKFFWIYGLLAVIGVLAGWASALRFGMASGNIGSGSSYEMILLFVFATLSASVLLKNNWVALGWTLLVALLWTMHEQAMILLNLSLFSMMVSNASWVFILLAVMFIAKHRWIKPRNLVMIN